MNIAQKRTIMIAICATLLAGATVWVFVAPPWKKRRILAGGFSPAPGRMVNAYGAAVVYKKKDYDRNGTKDFPLSIHELYFRTDSSGSQLALIPHKMAVADCLSDGDPDRNEHKWHFVDSSSSSVIDDAAPAAGYWFGVIKFMSDGTPYSEKRENHFAMCAFPHNYGEDFGKYSRNLRGYGLYTYILSEEGTLYRKDTGEGKYIEKWPSDLKNEGWEIIE